MVICVIATSEKMLTISSNKRSMCTIVSRGQTAFFRFYLGWREKGLVWFTVATRLGTPRCGGGVNGGNVICYYLLVTRAILVVLYKRV